MKTMFLFLILCFSQACMAGSTSGYACTHLQVTIKNNTANTCYLLTEELSSGIFSPAHDITFKIPAGSESKPVDIEQSDILFGVALELVYECGEGYYIRLYSQKNECGNINKTNAAVLHTANLTGTFQANLANYWTNMPAVVNWTIQ
ncbi:MAG: hypothetical protein NTU48_07490 [Legionellales bacterium]|nr:hypothetical protein [Legionellales bacterium]